MRDGFSTLSYQRTLLGCTLLGCTIYNLTGDSLGQELHEELFLASFESDKLLCACSILGPALFDCRVPLRAWPTEHGAQLMDAIGQVAAGPAKGPTSDPASLNGFLEAKMLSRPKK